MAMPTGNALGDRVEANICMDLMACCDSSAAFWERQALKYTGKMRRDAVRSFIRAIERQWAWARRLDDMAESHRMRTVSGADACWGA